MDEMMGNVNAPTDDTIDLGRKTIIEKLRQNKP